MRKMFLLFCIVVILTSCQSAQEAQQQLQQKAEEQAKQEANKAKDSAIDKIGQTIASWTKGIHDWWDSWWTTPATPSPNPVSSVTPSPEPNPLPNSSIYVVGSNNARGRKCPQLSCSTIVTFKSGQEIQVSNTEKGDIVDNNDVWLRVPYNKLTVYVHSSLASPKDSSFPATHRTIRVTIILALTGLGNTTINPAPGHDEAFYRQYFDMTARYHRDNSYNQVELHLQQLVTENGHFRVVKGMPNYNFPNLATKATDFTNAIDETCKVEDCRNTDIFIVIHSGQSADAIDSGLIPSDKTTRIASQTMYYTDDSTNRPYIVLGEDDPNGIWAHEMGHALGYYFHTSGPKSRWLTPHPQPRAALLSPCKGDTGTPTEMCYWDLLHHGGMAGFIRADGSRPTFMSSITRKYMGFLSYNDTKIGNSVWIDALETNTTPIGIKAVRVLSVKDSQQCYVLEVRTKNAKYSFWDQALPQTTTPGNSDAWLVVYLINNNKAKTECGDISGKDDDPASTSQDIVVQWVLDVPWIINHPEYPVIDPINGISFNIEKFDMTDSNIRVLVSIQGVH